MQEKSTIYGMLKEGIIIVPNYQRAYSWDTPHKGNDKKTQTDVFIRDLEEQINSNTDTQYYFGHFIFEQLGEGKYAIVDGQQRLTTIIMFISAAFSRIIEFRELNEEETRKYRIIRDGSLYPFSTVEYDNKVFRDYVINHEPIDIEGVDTVSAKRIIAAYDYFTSYLKSKDEKEVLQLIGTVLESECTTHVVRGEAEAVQRFIFQNDRGKHPSKLEVIKAHFMYYVLLYGGQQKNSIINDLQERFSEVYKNLSKLEGYLDEDSLLQIALRVRFNTLYWVDTKERIDKTLARKDQAGCDFIIEITHMLDFSSQALCGFFRRDELKSIDIHSVRVQGNYITLLPYIVKAYSFNLPIEAINQLCRSYIGIALRDSIIGTRAVLASRLEGDYQKFTKDNTDIKHIIDNFEFLKTVDSSNWWWAFWNNAHLKDSIQGSLNHSIGKFILWKYENYLISGGKNHDVKAGYMPIHFEQIESPELEHIAPQTAPSDHPENDGYDVYDDEFVNQYIDCLGNYLFLSKSHNCSASNNSFEVKREDYRYLEQQREIQRLTADSHIWNREQIAKRKESLIEFVLANL